MTLNTAGRVRRPALLSATVPMEEQMAIITAFVACSATMVYMFISNAQIDAILKGVEADDARHVATLTRWRL